MSCNHTSFSCSTFLSRCSFCPTSLQTTTTDTSTEYEFASNVLKTSKQTKKPNTPWHTQNKKTVESFYWLRQYSNFSTNNVTAPKIIPDIIGTLNCLLAWWFMIWDGFKSRSHWKTAFIIMIFVVVKLSKFPQLQHSYNRSYQKVNIYQLLLRSCHKRSSLWTEGHTT